MLSIDKTALEEWVIKNKHLWMIVVLFAGIVFVLWIILYRPMLTFYSQHQRIGSLRENLELKNKLILDHEILMHEKQWILSSFNKHFDSSREIKSIALWLNYYLRECEVSKFSFNEEHRVPQGGQGRPIFSVVLNVDYSQMLCVLLLFSHYSRSWHLSEMNLSREHNGFGLKMKLDMEELQ